METMIKKKDSLMNKKLTKTAIISNRTCLKAEESNAHASIMAEKKLLNKVILFVFFAHKKYSRSFVKLWLNH